MANKFTININLHGLIEQLENLPDVVNRQLVRGVMRQALEPTRELAQSLAPVRTGRLRKDIKLRAGRRSTTRITVLVQAGEPGHLAEEGFTDQAGVWHEGSHFMDRAFEQTEEQVATDIEDGVAEGILQYFGG